MQTQRKIKPVYTQLKNKSDVLVSKIVRKKGYCVKCGKTEHLQAAHIISRTYMATRYDLDNILCLCAGCHLWWHKEPIEASRWLEKEYPGLYDKLNFKRQAITKIDMHGMLLWLKQKDKETE